MRGNLFFIISVALIIFTQNGLSMTYLEFCDHDVTCEFEDEFTYDDENNEVIYTTTWDAFMAELEEKTFKNDYSFTCPKNSSIKVTLDYTTDFIWELRSELYQRHLPEYYNCYCSYDDCQIEGGEFKTCLNKVRQLMASDMTFWFSFQIFMEQSRLQQETEGCA